MSLILWWGSGGRDGLTVGRDFAAEMRLERGVREDGEGELGVVVVCVLLRI